MFLFSLRQNEETRLCGGVLLLNASSALLSSFFDARFSRQLNDRRRKDRPFSSACLRQFSRRFAPFEFRVVLLVSFRFFAYRLADSNVELAPKCTKRNVWLWTTSRPTPCTSSTFTSCIPLLLPPRLPLLTLPADGRSTSSSGGSTKCSSTVRSYLFLLASSRPFRPTARGYRDVLESE